MRSVLVAYLTPTWFAAVFLGGGCGAVLRWLLSLLFNNPEAGFQTGTFLANLIGAFIIGLAAAFFVARPNLSPEWRLLLITGILGGLTTFSTFSLEMVEHMLKGLWGQAALTLAGNLLGSLSLTMIGLLVGRKLWG